MLWQDSVRKPGSMAARRAHIRRDFAVKRKSSAVKPVSRRQGSAG